MAKVNIKLAILKPSTLFTAGKDDPEIEFLKKCFAEMYLLDKTVVGENILFVFTDAISPPCDDF